MKCFSPQMEISLNYIIINIFNKVINKIQTGSPSNGLMVKNFKIGKLPAQKIVNQFIKMNVI